jgi:hypothetical protein
MVTWHPGFVHPWTRAIVNSADSLSNFCFSGYRIFICKQHTYFKIYSIYTHTQKNRFVPKCYLMAPFATPCGRNPLIQHPCNWTGSRISNIPDYQAVPTVASVLIVIRVEFHLGISFSCLFKASGYPFMLHTSSYKQHLFTHFGIFACHYEISMGSIKFK